MLQAISGLDPNDPTSLPSPVPDMLKNADRGVAGIRVGFDENFACRDVDPQIASAVVASVQVLEELGAEIVEIQVPDVDQYLSAWTALCSAEAVAAHRGNYPARKDDYGPWFRFWLDNGAKVTGADYAEANNMRAACTGRLKLVFEQIDVIACPTLVDLPRRVTPQEGYESKPVLDWDFDRYHRFTVPFDFSGAPTLNLPCGMSKEGLPLSFQLVGKLLTEPLLCRVGAAFEAATEWHDMHPDC
jgi:amidase